MSDRSPTANGAGVVQSVDRALDLLEVLAEARTPTGIGELAVRTGLAQGTVHRLLRGLIVRGYVRRDAARKYSLGTAAHRMGDAAQRSFASTADGPLRRLVDLTGETANLAVLEGDDVVYLAQVSSPHPLRIFAEVGRHVRPHSTAVGKVLLADLPEADVTALLGRTGLPRRTASTITSRPAFLAALDEVRAQRWALDDGEEMVGVRCLAVPVLVGERVAAAVSISAPAERFADVDPPALAEQMLPIAGLLAGLLTGHATGAPGSSPSTESR